ncbi:MAG: hypothetical protein JXA50_01625 [Deltaproteobacteria bacterium]|nr:hypothetical protein [Deltaproteobacteria bacterium]
MVHVTEVLSIIDQGYGRADRAKLIRGQHIGREFHKHSLGWVKGAYFPAIKDPQIGGIVMTMVDSFKQWFDMAVKDVLCVEKELFDRKRNIQGRVDIILKLMKDEWWRVLDLKSVASLSRVVGLQLAGYQHLARIEYGFKRWGPRSALQFDKEGKRLLPRLVTFQNPLDLDAFFHAYSLRNHLKNGGSL